MSSPEPIQIYRVPAPAKSVLANVLNNLNISVYPFEAVEEYKEMIRKRRVDDARMWGSMIGAIMLVIFGLCVWGFFPIQKTVWIFPILGSVALAASGASALCIGLTFTWSGSKSDEDIYWKSRHYNSYENLKLHLESAELTFPEETMRDARRIVAALPQAAFVLQTLNGDSDLLLWVTTGMQSFCISL